MTDLFVKFFVNVVRESVGSTCFNLICLCFNSLWCNHNRSCVRCFCRGHPIVLWNLKDGNKYIYFQSDDRNVSSISKIIKYYCMLSSGLFPGVCSLKVEVSEHSVLSCSPMKIEQNGCSVILAFKLQTLGNNQEESIWHSKHGKSLKSRIIIIYYSKCPVANDLDVLQPIGLLYYPVL
jgi:hypothetical protein